MNQTLQSYKNDPKLKTLLLKEVENHRKADAIVKGTYGEERGGKWKGCAVGCSIHSLNLKLGKDYSTSDHSVYEKELGIPEWLARLEDTIFEGLPSEEAKKWPGQFLKAIPIGVNLEPVKWKISAFILSENITRVLSLDIADDLKKQVVDSVRAILNLHEEAIKTGEWNESASWSAASAVGAVGGVCSLFQGTLEAVKVRKVGMTTLKDEKEKVMEEFDDSFDTSHPIRTFAGWDEYSMVKDFLSRALDRIEVRTLQAVEDMEILVHCPSRFCDEQLRQYEEGKQIAVREAREELREKVKSGLWHSIPKAVDELGRVASPTEVIEIARRQEWNKAIKWFLSLLPPRDAVKEPHQGTWD